MNRLIQKYFGPKSEDPDIHRKELVLNSMLAFCFILFFVFQILTIRHEIAEKSYIGSIYFLLALFPFLASYYFSRVGKIRTASIIFISTFTIGAFYGIMLWSIFLPATLLSLSLMVILTGILINSRASFIFAIGIMFVLIILSILLNTNIISHDTTWQSKIPSISDSIEFGMFILFMSSITWISNRQTEQSLKRAQKSEQNLRQERDLLEIRVAERSRELENLQIEKISQLYKFIEFGKLSSGLIHDLINPLNSLCIEIENQSINKNLSSSADLALKNSVHGLVDTSKKIKDIIGSTKKHIQVDFKKEEFNLKDAINQTLLIHKYRFLKNNIEVKTKFLSDLNISASPSLFTHIFTNLISNAIDAIESAKSINAGNKNYRPIINIEMQTKDRSIILTIKDNGIGILPEHIPHIFNPFYSTKDGKGCGYGLSASRYMTEKYFEGTLNLRPQNTSYNHQKQIDKINKFKTVFELTLPFSNLK